jgi:hypothetical protein
MEIATRSRWKILPISNNAIKIFLKIEFDSTEFEKIKIGLIPQQMEDKWFIFFEDNWLYFHRSWTGFCLFKIKIEQKNTNSTTTELWVEKNTGLYPESEENAIAFITARLKYLSQRQIST